MLQNEINGLDKIIRKAIGQTAPSIRLIHRLEPTAMFIPFSSKIRSATVTT